MTAPRRTARTRKTAELPATNEAGPGSSGPAPDPDLDAILPDPAVLTVAGIPATVRRLQTRELMLAIRVITAGIGAGIAKVDLNAPKEELLPVIGGLLVTAIPDAPDEFLAFLRAVTDAVDKDRQQELSDVMHNPPPEVTLEIMAKVFEQEKDDFADLMGKGMQLFGFSQALYKTGVKRAK
jgi:hypothetical protein